MSLASLKTVIGWPGSAQVTDLLALGTDQTIDASGEYDAWIGVAREAMTISHVGFKPGTAAGSTVEVRIETVGTDGKPSGSLWAVNTNKTSGALSTNTWSLQALTASASITAGQAFCVMIKWASGTTVVQRISNYQETIWAVPYRVTNTSGSAVKANFSGPLGLVVGSSSTVFYNLVSALPVTAISANAFNNTNSAARGLRFQTPFKCRAVGLRVYQSGATGDFSIVMYDDAGAELSNSSTAVDGNLQVEGVSGSSHFYFDNPVTLDANTWYRAAIVPSSATNINMFTATLPSSDYRSGWPGGVNQHYATRASGTWTDTATDQVPILDVLIDQVDDGAPSGGGNTVFGGYGGVIL